MRNTRAVAVLLGLAVFLVAGSAAAQEELQITTKPHAEWTEGLGYAQTLTATGGVEPHCWSISEGEIPSGLALDPNGKLTGAPCEPGSFDFEITVRDASDVEVSLDCRMTINESILVYSANPAPWTVGRGVTTYLSAVGGTGSLSWRKSSGSLPPGIEVSPQGYLQGTPEKAGTFKYTLEVEDCLHAKATRDFAWVISDSPQLGRISSGAWTVQRSFSASIPVQGGTGPFEWKFGEEPPPPEKGEEPSTESELPEGVEFRGAGSTALISGTPREDGSFSFVVRVVDACGATASGEFELTIAKWPVVTTTTLPAAVCTIAYDQRIEVAYGTKPFTFRLLSGKLPEGLTLTDEGVIEGRPGATGRQAFTVIAEDSTGATAAGDLVIDVKAAVSIEPVTLSEWTADRAFEELRLSACGGDGDIMWFVEPSLPRGMYLSSSGILSGTPREAGLHEFDIVAKCEGGSRASFPVAWKVNPPPEVASSTLPEWVEGREFDASIAVTGGTEPVTVHVTSGSLPEGLSLLPSSMGARLSGTPGGPGEHAFTLTARDAHGATSQQSFELTVREAPVVSETEIHWTAGRYLSRVLTGREYIAPQQWRLVEGELPPGLYLRLEGLEAQVHGTPSTPGKHSFTIDFEDGQGVLESHSFSVTIHPVMNAEGQELLLASGRETNTFLPLTGGTPPHSWAVVSGCLPPGLTLASDTGLIAGCPEVPGTYEIVAHVQDGCQTTLAMPITLHVAERIYSGHRKETDLLADDRYVHYWFDALEGTKLGLKAKLAGEGEFPAVVLLDSEGNPIDLGGAASPKRSGYSIKNHPIASTGQYYLRLDNRESSASGRVKVSMTLKPPTRFGCDGELSGPGDTDVVAFPLPAGTLKLTLGADVRIDPGALVLETPDGDLISLAALGSLRSGEKRFVVKRISLPASGVYRLHVCIGGSGRYQAAIRVRPKLPHTCRLPE